MIKENDIEIETLAKNVSELTFTMDAQVCTTDGCWTLTNDARSPSRASRPVFHRWPSHRQMAHQVAPRQQRLHLTCACQGSSSLAMVLPLHLLLLQLLEGWVVLDSATVSLHCLPKILTIVILTIVPVQRILPRSHGAPCWHAGGVVARVCCTQRYLHQWFAEQRDRAGLTS